MKNLTLFKFGGKNAQKTYQEDTIFAENERDAKNMISGLYPSLDFIRAILTEEQVSMVESFEKDQIIDYDSISESDRADFAQLIWQNYVILVFKDVKKNIFKYKLSDTAFERLKRNEL